MKEIPLTLGYVALVDDEDYEELNSYKWHLKKDTHNLYAARSGWDKITKKCITVRMHRHIMKPNDSKTHIDHIDRNGLNNCKSNLRLATPSQNQLNRRQNKKYTSKYRGVSIKYERRGALTYKYWYASITINNKSTMIGRYKNEISAAIAYNQKAIETNGEFSVLNVIDEKDLQNKKQIQFYASDAKDTSIIAYGFLTDNPKPTDRKVGNDFKITWKNFRYEAWQKIGNKFYAIGHGYSLEQAQEICRENLEQTANEIAATYNTKQK